jgi:Fe2+ transport system protein FeoA
MSMTLDEVALGKEVCVSGLKSSSISTKLLEMGLFEGKSVTVLFRAPFGDPIAVRVGSYTLSLRLEEAQLVEVNILSNL